MTTDRIRIAVETIIRAPFDPMDLNCCAEFEKTLIGTDRYTYINHLRTIVGRRCEKNKIGTALVSDFDCKTALAIECCEAYLRVKGKWSS